MITHTLEKSKVLLFCVVHIFLRQLLENGQYMATEYFHLLMHYRIWNPEEEGQVRLKNVQVCEEGGQEGGILRLKITILPAVVLPSFLPAIPIRNSSLVSKKCEFN